MAGELPESLRRVARSAARAWAREARSYLGYKNGTVAGPQEGDFIDGFTACYRHLAPSKSDEEAAMCFANALERPLLSPTELDIFKRGAHEGNLAACTMKNAILIQKNFALRSAEAQLAEKDARIKELENALRFYAETSGRTQTVRGRVIEYDVDAGPLYEHYEVPLCDDGTVARSALNPKESQ